ncbi:MAG: hypothetical protein LN416_08620 [Candidatus Thermoplasmatota archaeon]|nr:hypothetical protein [Candidatus Thermoplasmatota archaeon]
MGRTTYKMLLPGARAADVKEVVLEWAKSRRIKVLKEEDERVQGRFLGGFMSRVALNFDVQLKQHLRGVKIHIEGWITGHGMFEEEFSPGGFFHVHQRAGMNILADLVDRLKAMG